MASSKPEYEYRYLTIRGLERRNLSQGSEWGPGWERVTGGMMESMTVSELETCVATMRAMTPQSDILTRAKQLRNARILAFKAGWEVWDLQGHNLGIEVAAQDYANAHEQLGTTPAGHEDEFRMLRTRIQRLYDALRACRVGDTSEWAPRDIDKLLKEEKLLGGSG